MLKFESPTPRLTPAATPAPVVPPPLAPAQQGTMASPQPDGHQPRRRQFMASVTIVNTGKYYVTRTIAGKHIRCDKSPMALQQINSVLLEQRKERDMLVASLQQTDGNIQKLEAMRQQIVG